MTLNLNSVHLRFSQKWSTKSAVLLGCFSSTNLAHLFQFSKRVDHYEFSVQFISVHDVSSNRVHDHDPPPGDCQVMRREPDGRFVKLGPTGEATLQPTQLRTRQEDEPCWLLLSTTGRIHGGVPTTDDATWDWRRVDYRAAGEELQSLPKEQPRTSRNQPISEIEL